MNNIHLTINTHPETFISSSFWKLYGHKEPERIAVRFKDKEYMIVLDENNPFFERWSLDEDGELNEIEATFGGA